MTRTITRPGRTVLFALVPLAIAGLALTGCGRTGGDETTAGSDVTIDDSPATGTVEFWAPGADAEDLPQLLEQFQKDNPDVEVKVTQIPSADFASKMTAAISAGTVPDMVFITTEEMPGMLATDGFEPVPDGLVNEDDFFPVSWNASVVDDVAYGVPWYTYAQTFQYRSDLAKSASIEAPTDWDELRSFAEALKNEGVEYPLALQVDWGIYVAQELNVFAHQNGGGLISDDGKTWTVNSPENIAALKFWSSFMTDGLASPDGPQFLDQVPYFSNGTNAAGLNGPWFPGWLNDANGADWTDTHLAMSVPPAGPSGDQSSSVGGGNLFVLKGAKNTDGAWKLARYMAQPDTQVDWYGIFGNLPANSTAWEDPAIADAPYLADIRESIEVGTTVPNASTWGQVGKIVGSAMEQVARGQATAQDALDDAQSQAESIGTGR